MTAEPVGVVGMASLRLVTDLLRRVRLMHPTCGVWEAADFHWWWRRRRPTDGWGHLFWLDQDGRPIGAAVLTDWSGQVAVDVITLPDATPDWIWHVTRAGFAAVRERHDGALEMMVDRDDAARRAVLAEFGFTRSEGEGTAAWMGAAARPPVSAIAPGYRLVSRAEHHERPHHFIPHNGADVEARLSETSMYRPDLDLCIVDETTGDAAAYGLFWLDPVTGVGFVEPMGAEEGHRRQGLARHVLTSGLDRLSRAGATRLKVNFESDNEPSSALYGGVGFVPTMTTSMYVLGE